MANTLLKNITTLIWDADGTLYPKDEAYFEADYRALAETVAGLGIMPEGEAYEKAKASEIKYGGTYEVFILEYGVDFETLDKAFYENLGKIIPSFLRPDPELIALFRKTSQHATNVVLTHNTENWARKILAHSDLQQFFDHKNMMSKENLKIKKDEGVRAFMDLCKQLNANPAETAVIEDTPKNLIFPKELGMRTVFISGQKLLSKPKAKGFEKSIDLTYPDIKAFISDFLSSQTK